jgi:hypothetical protein
MYKDEVRRGDVFETDGLQNRECNCEYIKQTVEGLGVSSAKGLSDRG